MPTKPAKASRPPRGVPRWVRLADALSALLAVVAAWIVAFGGLDVRVGGTRLSARSEWRAILALAFVIAARHLAFRHPTIVERSTSGLRNVRNLFRSVDVRGAAARMRAFATERWPSVIAVLPAWSATRFGVLAAGLIGLAFMGYAPGNPSWRSSADDLWNLPARWDAGWYIGIAMVGYERAPDWSSQSNLAFFPAYPLVMWLVGLGQLGEPEVALLAWVGVAVSIAAFLGALVYVYKFTREFGSDENARAATWLLACYPCAVFFSAAYTESLYLLGATAACYHTWRRQCWPAAAWALLVGLTRPNGMFLSIPLAVMALWPALFAWRHPQAPRPSAGPLVRMLVPAALPIVGALAFFAYLWALTGHPFAWREVQVAGWAREYEGLGGQLWYALTQVWAMGPADYLLKYPIDALDLAATLFALATLWPVTRRLGPALGLLVAINTLTPVLFVGLVSMGRFTSVLFPIFMWLGLSLGPRARMALAVLFAMGQGLGATAHFTWRPFF